MIIWRVQKIPSFIPSLFSKEFFREKIKIFHVTSRRSHFLSGILFQLASSRTSLSYPPIFIFGPCNIRLLLSRHYQVKRKQNDRCRKDNAWRFLRMGYRKDIWPAIIQRAWYGGRKIKTKNLAGNLFCRWSQNAWHRRRCRPFRTIRAARLLVQTFIFVITIPGQEKIKDRRKDRAVKISRRHQFNRLEEAHLCFVVIHAPKTKTSVLGDFIFQNLMNNLFCSM